MLKLCRSPKIDFLFKYKNVEIKRIKLTKLHISVAGGQ